MVLMHDLIDESVKGSIPNAPYISKFAMGKTFLSCMRLKYFRKARRSKHEQKQHVADSHRKAAAMSKLLYRLHLFLPSPVSMGDV
jgi:hypothetical protein